MFLGGRMFKRIKTLFTLLVIALFTTVSAANLTGYLPNSTALAFGGVDVKGNEHVFDTFIDEWNNRGLTDLFKAVLGDEFDEDDIDMPDELADLEFLDVLGTEFWFAVGGN